MLQGLSFVGSPSAVCGRSYFAGAAARNSGEFSRACLHFLRFDLHFDTEVYDPVSNSRCIFLEGRVVAVPHQTNYRKRASISAGEPLPKLLQVFQHL
jgi:hypothetical protein